MKIENGIVVLAGEEKRICPAMTTYEDPVGWCDSEGWA